MDDLNVYDEWLRRVPHLRREKAEVLKNPKVRKQSLAAGALLTCVLREYLPVSDMRDVRIAENEHGRPYLPDYPQIHFSLSHSNDRTMCAVSHTDVGCDVEAAGKTEADEKRIRYVSRCLTDYERELSLADAGNFYRIWTLKESFVKMTGQGLFVPLSSFEIRLDPAEIRQNIISTKVELKEYGQIDGYQYACAAQGCTIADDMVCVDLEEAL